MADEPFPNLVGVSVKQTSEKTEAYNCIAWAFEDNTRWWWPMRGCYWPIKHFRLSIREAFDQAFEGLGWKELPSGQTVGDSTKRIALYEIAGEPTHAARWLGAGVWTSKLGSDIDLQHELGDLDGPLYGSVARIYVKDSSPPV